MESETPLSCRKNFQSRAQETIQKLEQSCQMIPATTSDLREEAFRLRHKIYCESMNYEPLHSSGKERDAFDRHATQMLVYNRPMNRFIGCLRLIHSWHEGQRKILPFEEHCKNALDQNIVQKIKNSDQGYAEASRFGIDKDQIRLWNQSHTGIAKEQGRLFSSLLLPSMYLGLFALAKAQNVSHIFAIVEPRLLQNMNYYGIDAHQIGGEIHHRGTRVPIMTTVQDLESKISPTFRPLYERFSLDISRALEESAERRRQNEPQKTASFVPT